MFDTLLVANRGEIARRVIRTARRMGLRTVAVHSDVDANLPFVTEADVAVAIGAAAPAESYRNVEAILRAARETGAQAIHPGYGFLSENADFARAVVDAGLIWVGPSADVIEQMGDKINARNLLQDAGVPVAAGTREPVTDAAAARSAADGIGFPVMLKASAGGGGMGMSVAHGPDEVAEQFERIAAFAERMFGDASVLLERFLPVARHVEVQILGLPADGDRPARVVALGERDCSVQRRNQKVAEETPSPGVGPDLRARMLAAAVRAGEAVGYVGAGTVECLVDEAAQDFVFLEMNTRLQVEHPITEAVTGLDLVEQQLLIAGGQPITFDPDGVTVSGHAIELRINAEDPKRFLPGPGAVRRWDEPSGAGVRVDSGYAAGTTVTPSYDSLMAKLIVHGADRDEALGRAREAVAGFAIEGPKCNLPFFAELLEHPEFVSGHYDTGIVGRMRASGR
ncbi:biotin carboxylase [Nakamurella flava]|uniref:biotin carboxylase n=1 Tax=Nakamurella flava TaxID=2576308 RepID=A0A4U6QAY5_9ACTN|nr:biotin carboxylase N-terminal domain-containing protein [Nakamurella flava]TKV57121.1 biotin carboxylase [Nakamurella flava]